MNLNAILYVTFIFILQSLCKVDSLQRGAPCSSVETMTPAHGNRSIDMPAPFAIQFFGEYPRKATCYLHSKSVTVQISVMEIQQPDANTTSSPKVIQGFTLQARKGTRKPGKQRTGRFVVANNKDVKFHCDEPAAVTHTNANNKMQANVTFIPSALYKGAVFFQATVAQSRWEWYHSINGSLNLCTLKELATCGSSPCKRGTCKSLSGYYKCTCPPGSTGINCETNFNECGSNPCVHGVCSDLRNYYVCFCKPGYTGTNCDRDIDDCIPNPCKNDGQCIDRLNGYICTDCRIGYSGKNCEIAPIDCADVKENYKNATSGVYEIQPSGSWPIFAYCDMETLGGGWTIFQRRINGEEDFMRNWNDYKQGFGNVSREHWLGNDAIHNITHKNQDQDLLIELQETNITCFLYAQYSSFTIDSEKQHYKLNLKNFNGGSAGDSLSYHKGAKFSTNDQDHDSSAEHCARENKGGWWYYECAESNLNGRYESNTCAPDIDGRVLGYISWSAAHTGAYSFGWTEMKMRRHSFKLANAQMAGNWCTERSCNIRCNWDEHCPDDN